MSGLSLRTSWSLRSRTSLRQRALTLASLRPTSKLQDAVGLVTPRSRRRTPTQQAATGQRASSGQLCLGSKLSAFSTAGARPSEPMSWLALHIQGRLGINFQPRYAIARQTNNHVIIADQTVKTHGKKCDRTRVDVSCLCSCQLETILISPRMRKARQTGFLTRLDPWRNEIEEQFQGDMSKPGKNYKTEWKGVENAVYWIFLDLPQKKDMTFWQTKTHAIIAHTTVISER